MDQQSLYEILGLESTASEQEIRAAYKAKIREEHPDKIGPKLNETCSNKAHLIIEAYKVLSTPPLKAQFDQELNGNFRQKNVIFHVHQNLISRPLLAFQLI